MQTYPAGFDIIQRQESNPKSERLERNPRLINLVFFRADLRYIAVLIEGVKIWG
jgi:hypothetical protein